MEIPRKGQAVSTLAGEALGFVIDVSESLAFLVELSAGGEAVWLRQDAIYLARGRDLALICERSRLWAYRVTET